MNFAQISKHTVAETSRQALVSTRIHRRVHDRVRNRSHPHAHASRNRCANARYVHPGNLQNARCDGCAFRVSGAVFLPPPCVQTGCTGDTSNPHSLHTPAQEPLHPDGLESAAKLAEPAVLRCSSSCVSACFVIKSASLKMVYAFYFSLANCRNRSTRLSSVACVSPESIPALTQCSM